MANPQCLPATNIQQAQADLHGTADNVLTHVLTDDWAGAAYTAGPSGTPHTATNSNFAGTSITVTEFNDRADATLVGGDTFGISGLTPGDSNGFIDLGAPRNNIFIRFTFIGTEAGETLENLSPAAIGITGTGVLSNGNTTVTPTVTSATSDFTLQFPDGTQVINYTYRNTLATLRGQQPTITFDSPPPDKLNLALGTTPGGPYPIQLPVGGVAGNNTVGQPVDQTFAGLTPGTTYYYRLETRDFEGSLVEASSECSFSTPPPPTVNCDPATLITFDSAVLNGDSLNALVGQTYEFQYGTTPGGPYDHTTGQIAASGASPEVFQAPISTLTPGTTYYYIAVIRDSGQDILATSSECSFDTIAATLWCGGYHDPGDCDFVDPGNSEPYFNCNDGI